MRQAEKAKKQAAAAQRTVAAKSLLFSSCAAELSALFPVIYLVFWLYNYCISHRIAKYFQKNLHEFAFLLILKAGESFPQNIIAETSTHPPQLCSVPVLFWASWRLAYAKTWKRVLYSIRAGSANSSSARGICDPLCGALVSLARDQPQGSSRWEEKANEYENENENENKNEDYRKSAAKNWCSN